MLIARVKVGRDVFGGFRSDEPEREKGSSTMRAKNLEKMFDEGKDVTPHLDLSKVRRPGHEQRRVNVDFSQLDHRFTRRSIKPYWRNEAIGDQIVDCRAIEG